MTAPTATSGNAASFSAASDNVFARIAGRYDFLCDVFSLYAHRLWKARMAEVIASTPAAVVLDVASGTGDIPFRLLRRLRLRPEAPPRRILVTDLCPEMRALAERKIGTTTPGVEFSIADAHDLAGIAPDSVDLYSISFGMRSATAGTSSRRRFACSGPEGSFSAWKRRAFRSNGCTGPT